MRLSNTRCQQGARTCYVVEVDWATIVPRLSSDHGFVVPEGLVRSRP